MDAGRLARVHTDTHWLTLAVDLAVANIAEGGGPFGAAIVADGVLIGSGANRVTADLDPTAHAEVVAIRGAGVHTGMFDLSGATLYASCEPCPMCLAASLWARLDRVVFAADRYAAARAGFDDLRFYEAMEVRPQELPIRLERLELAESEAPFDAWRGSPAKVPY